MRCFHNNQVGECLENSTDCYPQSWGRKICCYSSQLDKRCLSDKVLKYDRSLFWYLSSFSSLPNVISSQIPYLISFLSIHPHIQKYHSIICIQLLNWYVKTKFSQADFYLMFSTACCFSPKSIFLKQVIFPDFFISINLPKFS